MKKISLFVLAVTLLFYGCRLKGGQDQDVSITPTMASKFRAGDVIKVKVSFSVRVKPDSILYLLDSVKMGVKKDSSIFLINTDTLPMGSRLITARVFKEGRMQEVSTSIILRAKAPELLGFKVEKVFPHDTSCFTEGLFYQDGFLYESGGGTPALGLGISSLRKVDLTTGKVLQRVNIDSKVFAEGISIVGDKLIQLTWKDPKIGYVYDKHSFKRLKTFTNNVGLEGWGLCFDGKRLYMDDSSNRIWFLDKETYQQTGYIDVYDEKDSVNKVNELEYIGGKLYANIWQTDTIVVINPKTGAVLQRVDLSALYPRAKRAPNADVMNGIAWDEKGKRLFITGKKWPKLYQVSFSKM